jgi:tetratricopeptide (TPR) repeat protein
LKDDYANALPDLDEAIRLNPDAPGYYINRGLARYHLNNLRGTLDDFDSVIRLDPNNALAWYNRGLIRSQVGDLNRAIEDFDKVIQLDPHHHVAIYNRALVRTQVGEYKAAINDLDLSLTNTRKSRQPCTNAPRLNEKRAMQKALIKTILRHGISMRS